MPLKEKSEGNSSLHGAENNSLPSQTIKSYHNEEALIGTTTTLSLPSSLETAQLL